MIQQRPTTTATFHSISHQASHLVVFPVLVPAIRLLLALFRLPLATTTAKVRCISNLPRSFDELLYHCLYL